MQLFPRKEYSNSLINQNGTQTPKFTYGVVYNTNPATYTVDVYVDGKSYLGVPIMGHAGNEFNTDTTILENLNYSTVILINMGATYYVLGSVPRKNNIRSSDPQKDTIDLANTIPVGDPSYNGAEYASSRLNDYQASRPIDIIPGDKVLSLSNGTMLGLLREGVAKLKASSLCQFLLFKYKDLARLVARSVEIFTDFGEITIGHDKSDKVGLHLKGGSSFTEETHPGKANWTVQVWAGSASDIDPSYQLKSEDGDLIQQSAAEDVRLYIRVNDAANGESTSFTMDTKGHIILSMTGDNRQAVTKNKITQIGQDEIKDITGNRTLDVQGDEETSIIGDKTSTVGGDKTVAVVGQLSMTGNDGVSINSSRKISIQTTGEVEVKASKITFGSI